MKEKTICDRVFSVVEDGDVLTASIKSERNSASQAVVSALKQAYSELKKYYSDVVGYMNSNGFSYYAYRYKRIVDKIDAYMSSIEPHYSTPADGDPVEPGHVNELYDWPAKVAKGTRMMYSLISGMSLGTIENYFEGLDGLNSCLGGIRKVHVRHLDLIQAEHWNAILDMLERCCLSLKYLGPNDKKDLDNMMRRAIVYLTMIDEAPEKILDELKRCIEEGVGCDKAYADARRWIISKLIDNTLMTLDITHISDLKDYIVNKLPYIKLYAMLSKLIDISPDAEKIISRADISNIKIEVSDYIVNEITNSAKASVAIAKDLLVNGQFQGNELFSEVTVACLGIVYIGPVVGANDKYFVEQGTCDELNEYGLLTDASICKANLLYIIWSVQSENFPNTLMPIGVISVYYGFGWVRIQFHIVTKGLTNAISICIKYFSGGMRCFVTGDGYGLNRSAELYADIYGNLIASGFEETRPAILS